MMREVKQEASGRTSRSQRGGEVEICGSIHASEVSAQSAVPITPSHTHMQLYLHPAVHAVYIPITGSKRGEREEGNSSLRSEGGL